MIEASKIFKITYSINILPGIGECVIDSDPKTGEPKQILNEEVNMMGLLKDSDELEMFDSKSIIELIEFKWTAYCFEHHAIGCILHMFYLAILIIYVNIIYIKNTGTDSEKAIYVILLAIGIAYP